MPITFHHRPDRNAVFATATGIIGRDDILEYFQAKVRARILEEPELFDARQICLDLAVDDLAIIAEAVSGQIKTLPRTAIVSDSAIVLCMAESFRNLMELDSGTFRAFGSLREAEAWLFREEHPAVGDFAERV
ncbi:MAG: hypothetical protein ABI680_20940 [Chthoniobacteraceae bacterium]